jgi:hypothetical protein
MSCELLIFCHTNIKHAKGEIAIEIKYTVNFPRDFIGITCCIISEKPYTCETQTILHRQGITHGYCYADKLNVFKSNCFSKYKQKEITFSY